eukprot:jgi/Tetstr1/437707/TSEL_026362.t1
MRASTRASRSLGSRGLRAAEGFTHDSQPASSNLRASDTVTPSPTATPAPSARPRGSIASYCTMTLIGPSKILPPLAGAAAIAAVMYFGMDKAFGGPYPSTVTDPACPAATFRSTPDIPLPPSPATPDAALSKSLLVREPL